jgi:hypothetical protein
MSKETFYEDRNALKDLEADVNSPEDQAVIEEYAKELGGVALAIEQDHKNTLARLAKEEQLRNDDNDWRTKTSRR